MIATFPALQQNPYLPNKTWLRALQQKQLADFLQRGFPSRREERWKYTDTTVLAKKNYTWNEPHSIAIDGSQWLTHSIRMVFINGYLSTELSDLALLPDTIQLSPLSQIIETQEDVFSLLNFDAEKYPFACLNTAFMADGVYLKIPDHVTVEIPIHCVFINTAEITSPRNIIVLGDHSKVTVLEDYFSPKNADYLTNTLTHITAGTHAEIDYYKIQQEASQAHHMATVRITQKKESRVSYFNLSQGSRLARDSVHVIMQEPGANCELNGFYHLREVNQHSDHQLQIDHHAEHCSSAILYKGILETKSQAVFNGKIYVEKNAQKIHSQQANHNLILAEGAEVNTKPELEIYADNIKCSHGATVGQLQPDALFYLRARGLTESDAKDLLKQAFAADVFAKIKKPALRDYFAKRSQCHVI